MEVEVKKVGIVGGIGPVSTLDYYSGIINGCRAKANDDNYPEIVIDSINMTEMLSYVSNEDWDSLVNMLLNAIKNLANAGANFAAIASNTPHIVFDKVQKKSALPLISIVEATSAYVQERGCKSVVVLGTRFTMSNGLYSDALTHLSSKTAQTIANTALNFSFNHYKVSIFETTLFGKDLTPSLSSISW